MKIWGPVKFQGKTGQDSYWSQIETINDVESTKDCANLCLKNPECVFFNYDFNSDDHGSPNQYWKRCTLHKSGSQQESTLGVPTINAGHRCNYGFPNGHLGEPKEFACGGKFFKFNKSIILLVILK